MSTKVIGEAISRIDGYLKVTGTAQYSTDFPVKNVAHAYVLKSTIAAGKIAAIDTDAVSKSPGVLGVITHKNAFKLTEGGNLRGGGILQSPAIDFYGQHIAVVVADTYEQARHAARLIKVTYDKAEGQTDFDKSIAKAAVPRSRADAIRGDVDAALAAAAHKIDAMYTTPIEHHQPMEPHSTIAVWEGGNLTLYNASQIVGAVQNALANTFGLKPENVRVITPHVGGGFGSKGGAWGHVVLTAMAAKMLDRPVKLALTRQNMFDSVGLRQRNNMRLRIGSSSDGKITALAHDTVTHTATTGEFVEAVVAKL